MSLAPSEAELEVGAMFWPWFEPLETLKILKQWGVRCGQLGMHGEADLSSASAMAWRAACAAEDFTIATVFAAYEGEGYADIATVESTVGLVPASTRARRIERTLRLSDFARTLGVPSIACHVGFVPDEASNATYLAVRDAVRTVCDYAAGNGQTFALETGQEPADALRQFMDGVDRPNLRINFDPANLILYGTGDPIAALDVLGPWIASVHAKDGDWPVAVGQLGIERRLGEGSVGMERFVDKLKQIGYRGGLFVEREVEPLATRLADMRFGIELLRTMARVQ
jgi:L-ribulose-5-phosphate 3-epimerase